MEPDILSALEEQLPELATNRQYVRCLDRLVRSLPAAMRRRLARPLVRAAVTIGSGAACFHADRLNGARPTREERESHRSRALQAIRRSRDLLRPVGDVEGVERAELLVAGELLDRMEEMLRDRRPGRIA